MIKFSKLKQLRLAGRGFDPVRVDHGGEVGTGKRKSARPFSARLAVHVVMRATAATKNSSMLTKKHRGVVYLEIDRAAIESNLKLYRYANVGNHLHIIVKARTRRDLQRFLRVLAGRIAMRITGARKGKPLRERFWTKLAYTRLIEWGRAFTSLQQYLAKNLREAHGHGAHFISDYIDFQALAPPR